MTGSIQPTGLVRRVVRRVGQRLAPRAIPHAVLGRLHRGARRLRRDESGVTVVEFALIAPVFLALTFASYDVGIVMLRQSLLAQAVDKTMRDVRLSDSTAQVPLDTFIKNVCDRSLIIIDCEKQLVVDLVPIGPRAVNVPDTAAPCTDVGPSDDFIRPLMRYQPNVRGQILFVRVCATSAPLVPWGLSNYLVSNKTGRAHIVVTSAFMGEGT